VIGDLADERARGALFGWYYALVGIVSIPAGLLLGTLWQVWGSHAAYGFAAAAGFVATGFLVMQTRKSG
jgi:dipeptide/tripeptide permease